MLRNSKDNMDNLLYLKPLGAKCLSDKSVLSKHPELDTILRSSVTPCFSEML